MKNSIDTKEDIQTLLDCFTGYDGGVSFCRLKFFLNSLSKEIPSDLECLKIVNNMAKLVRAVNKSKNNDN